jgi:Mycobacteriophage tail assembly protein
MSKFTLEDLKAATERKLGPTEFALPTGKPVVLPSIFRLGKTTRDQIIKSMEELDKLDDLGDGDDDAAVAAPLVDAIAGILKLVNPDSARLIKAIGADDDPLLKASVLGEVLQRWMVHTQAGEA